MVSALCHSDSDSDLLLTTQSDWQLYSTKKLRLSRGKKLAEKNDDIIRRNHRHEFRLDTISEAEDVDQGFFEN